MVDPHSSDYTVGFLPHDRKMKIYSWKAYDWILKNRPTIYLPERNNEFEEISSNKGYQVHLQLNEAAKCST